VPTALQLTEIPIKNDQLRTTFDGGTVAVHGTIRRSRYVNDILDRVQAFTAFTPECDPYGAHDGGVFTFRGREVMWKIHYFDPTWTRNVYPNDPDCLRVLTVSYL